MDTFPEALEEVGKVLHRYDGAKGHVWKQQGWHEHLRHEKAHLISAEVMEDRGG